MPEPLSRETLRSVYDRVAGWYDWQHATFTLNSDQRGRELLVERTVNEGDRVIDAGAGTGTTSLMAARRVGSRGEVVLYDLSEGMLDRARQKACERGLDDPLRFEQGDMTELPFEDEHFDAAISTYAMCTLYDPAEAIRELYRVVKPGGRIGVAHSVEPENPLMARLAELAERVYWKIPQLSLGCQPVDVLPALEEAGAEIVFKKRIGVPLWPFLVYVAEKPESSSDF